MKHVMGGGVLFCFDFFSPLSTELSQSSLIPEQMSIPFFFLPFGYRREKMCKMLGRLSSSPNIVPTSRCSKYVDTLILVV